MQTRLALLEQSVSSTASEIEKIKSRWWQIVMMILPGILGSVLGISAVM
jgi:NhaP-type Na+/H+ or K+/H+ antiporter